MPTDAPAIFEALFGRPVVVLAEELLTRAKLPAAYESQELGKGQPSLASSGTIISALGAIQAIPDGSLAPSVAEIESWIEDDGSLRTDITGRQHKTTWAASLCLLALTVRPHLIGDLDRVRLLAQHVVSRQLPTGGWPLREGEAGSHPVYCLYPLLALLRSRTSGVLGMDEVVGSIAALAPYLHRTAENTATDASRQLIAAYCLARTAQIAPDLVDTDLLGAIESRLEGVLWREGKMRLQAPTVHSHDQPLWFAKLNRPLHYLLARQFWPLMHPISAVLGHELVASFDRETLGWRNDAGIGPPYSWTTGLGLLAGSLLALDASRLGLDAATWLERAEDFSNAADPYEYDVVISFSGEEREIAERIRDRLVQAGLRVFYDRDHQHELLGEDLAETLQRTYFARSRYAVAVLSRAFLESNWARNWEWKAILARMVQSHEAYLLPYRWETDVEIPGLNPTLGYVSRNDANPEEFAEIVIRKVLLSRSED